MSATPTTEEIVQLRDEAHAAGNFEMVDVATQALHGNQEAVTACAAVIEAQQMGTEAEGVEDG